MSYSRRSGSILNMLGGGRGRGEPGPVPPRANPGLSFPPASHSSQLTRLSARRLLSFLEHPRRPGLLASVAWPWLEL